jgi:hypothetical protein
MDWYELTRRYHDQACAHECRLSSLPEEWQRELAALWRVEADVNNGGYLQFFTWWGRESYDYAVQALTKIGACRMADVVRQCQALVDEYFISEGTTIEQRESLMPNRVIVRDGQTLKSEGSILPASVVDRIYQLSYEFMEYPDDVAGLGLEYYREKIEGE